MKCSCGEQGELKVFNTFQYYYCNKCKAEIEKPEEKPFDPFDPNTGSIDDFYLDLSRAKGKDLDRLADLMGIQRISPIVITLPQKPKDYQFHIYRNRNPIPEIYESNGKNWKNVSPNN